MIIYVVLTSLFYAAVNYMLLIITSIVVHKRIHQIRFIAAAISGGIWCGLCLILRSTGLGRYVLSICIIIAMSLVAYGINKNNIICCLVYSMLNISLGGLSSGWRGALSLFFGSLGIFIVHRLMSGTEDQIVPVKLQYNGQVYKLKALIDTGNKLLDPITGQGVLVVDAKISSDITGLTQNQLRNPTEAIKLYPGLRLIPYKTIDNSGSFLLAMRIQESEIGNKQGSAIIAFSPEILNDQGKYQALTGGYL